MSEVIVVFLWWLAIQLMGYAVWPLLARWLRWLPDRGYMLAKPIGLLFTAYALWLLSSVGLAQNTSGGIIAIVIGLALFSVWAYRTDRHEGDASLIGLWREHRNLFIAYEIVFALALVAWATFRMHAPDLSTTEKPMEFAFFNAINRSPFFPPHDPWLSGYAIAYYYFGYVMMSVMYKLTGVTAGVAFGMSNAFWFALAAASAFGVTANLVLLFARTRQSLEALAEMRRTPHHVQAATITFGVLAAVMLVLMGNLIGPLEVAHASAVGSPEVWQWLDVRELNGPAVQNPPDVPWWSPRPGWWWWRGSRVLHDYPPDQVSPVLAAVTGLPAAPPDVYQEAIDEFPQFSFLLGDMHPHVLALPFVIVMMGLALNLYLGAARGQITKLWSAPWWPLYALAVGGLSFLNTWDFPIYAFVMIAALGLGYWRARKTRWWEILYDALVLGAAGLAFYILFYRGFTSQAAGLAPNLYNGTRFVQFFVMFGVFLTIGFMFGITLTARAVRRNQTTWKHFAGLLLAGGFGLVVVLAALGLGIGYGITVFSARARDTLNATLAAMAQNGLTISAHLQARLRDPWTPLLLAVAVTAIGILWWVRRKPGTMDSFLSALKGRPVEPTAGLRDDPPESPLDFVLLLFAVGLLLTLSTEFVFLADTFGYRMNTIFKFYYQAWALWSVAAAFAAYYLISGAQLKPIWRWLSGVLIVGLVLSGLVYPAMALPTMMVEHQTPTLDAMEYTARGIPDQAAAIRWLDRNVPGRQVILEAPGEQYNPGTSRFSTWTGLPTVVGWGGHENQWRGNADIYGPRLDQINEIYTTSDPVRMMDLLNGFKVRYIIVGPNEQRLYPPGDLLKFAQYFPVAFQQGDVTIYQVP